MTSAASSSDSTVARGLSWKRLLVGRPLATDEADHQRLTKRVGLAVFSSDAISSTAYATGEVSLVLVAVAGMPSSRYLMPIAIAVIVLLALVANSYRETIHAYPDGGGSYIVSRENVGCGRVAAHRLRVDRGGVDSGGYVRHHVCLP